MAINTKSLDLERGSSQYASITDAAQTGLDLTTTVTMECWINIESLPGVGEYYGLMGKDDDVGRSYNWFIYNDSGSYEIHAIALNGANYDYYKYVWSTPTIATWYHLAITINVANASASTFEFFINGASKGNGTSVHADNISSIANTAGKFYIGNEAYSTDDYFDGKIDEAIVWSDIRTSQEILNSYNGGKGTIYNGTEAGMVAYWRFEDNLNDTTSNGNNLTGSGSPTYSTDVPFTNRSANMFLMF